MNKDQLRQQTLSRRRAMTAQARTSASSCIQQRLLNHLIQASEKDKNLRKAPLLVYRSLNDEVDTTQLFEPCTELAGRDIYAPVTQHAGDMHWQRITPDTIWQTGSFGILEPAEGSPCLGKGCIDRWLGKAKKHILLSIGLAFACQECSPIPAEDHDIPLDIIITEEEIIACRNY
jgi:5-formyltetrahydrofolate cyclo-ligase